MVIDFEHEVREMSQNADLDLQGSNEALLQIIEGSGTLTTINDEIKQELGCYRQRCYTY